jgi:citrate synthase
MLCDAEQKIARPRQIFTGHDVRDFVPIEQRKAKEFRAAA